ncbi:alanine racemase [Phaeobacter sp. J2-8]|uniref:alanine racemase n=1 Tax=Phaeobacter sp. J2-8 TaxID=2931394 RepID=UPI001FD0089D|nr:alanine racemase [Phaeobacter sp. J2-8]MCJ7872399.1 alanine racemase [Phaeobacter sp. J2-8]
MAQAKLTIDLEALRSNWRNLNALSAGETAAVVKADGYGLGVSRVARALAREGARRFFVALAEEGAALREALGPGPEIYVFSGHMPGDTDMVHDLALTPMINNIDQMLRHVEALPGAPFGIQLDTGMNRLGMEPAEWAALRDIALAQNPVLVMSHLACSDTPDHPMNAQQLQTFRDMTDGIEVPRSLAATGGILLGPDYHFDLTRPGIGLYGGLPFVDAAPVVNLDIPVIQVREVAAGESVGYGNAFIAERDSRIATISAGYADGLRRAIAPRASLYANDIRCPVVGRVSMDLIGVDVTDLRHVPDTLELLGRHQSIDTVADWDKTIGYEVLTALRGGRLSRVYRGE